MTEAAATAPADGIRVIVRDGQNEGEPRKGTYVGEVTVYAILDEETGNLLSMKDAETRPEAADEQIVRELGDNPKIVLDDGETVYGCQVWWEYEDTTENHIRIQEFEISKIETYLAGAKDNLEKLKAEAASPTASTSSDKEA